MRDLDTKLTVAKLNAILETELAGVVRYTHYALMVTGPNRIPIVDFMKAQATESLTHAHQVGEILTGLEGHPSLKISPLEETHDHSILSILTESLNHERGAVQLYKDLLEIVGRGFGSGEDLSAVIRGSGQLRHRRPRFRAAVGAVTNVRRKLQRPGQGVDIKVMLPR